MDKRTINDKKNDIIERMISSASGRDNLAAAMTQPIRDAPDLLYWCPKCGWFYMGKLGIAICKECSTRKNKVQLNAQNLPPDRILRTWNEQEVGTRADTIIR